MKATKFHPSTIVLAVVLGLCLVTGASAQLTLPYSGSYSGTSIAFKVTDSGWTNAGWFEIANASNATTALVGITSGTGRGLYGLTLKGDHGVYGESRKSGGAGVWGVANTGAAATGVYGVSQNGRGVVGVSYNGEAGVKGRCNKTDGVGTWGIADTGTSSKGVYGQSVAGVGVYGASTNNDGVVGSSTAASKSGVYGFDNVAGGAGVTGRSTDGTGVAGFSTTGIGVYGENSNTSRVGDKPGVYGKGDAEDGGQFISTNGNGVYGSGHGHGGYFSGVDEGVYGSGASWGGYFSGTNNGVMGSAAGSGNGIYGYNSGTGRAGFFWVNNASNAASAFEVWSNGNASSRGIESEMTGLGDAGYFWINNASNGHNALYATTNGTGNAGEFHVTNASNTAAGVYSLTNGTGYAGAFRIYNTSSSAAALYCYTTGTGHALWCNGTANINGTIYSAGGAVKIDDPLDPANKYLSHSFVESPDMKNIYDGNVVTDANGDAAVTLPDYFEALNTDFRYQLTVIGQFAQAIVATEISGNAFTIETDKPNVKVSWQVTGIRQDAWANANRIPVEEDKPAAEQGTYLHPEAFGQPATMGVDAVREAEKG